MTAPPRILPCGDTALSVEFGERIAPGITARVMALDAALRTAPLPGLVETVPTYRALLVILDPEADPDEARTRLAALAARPVAEAPPGRLWRVPVVYGGPHGADLEAIAGQCGLSPAAYAARHAAGSYTVAMIGFQPGFCYLAGLDPVLALPRRPAPRARVPASSISVGGVQTAIGSVESPSGWHLIGRTPVRPFQPGRAPVFLFQPGDRIAFAPVPAADWAALDAAAARGEPVAEPLA